LIDESEWPEVLNIRNGQHDEKFGGHIEFTEDEKKEWFDALNSLTPAEADGISVADFERSEKVIASTVIAGLLAA